MQLPGAGERAPGRPAPTADAAPPCPLPSPTPSPPAPATCCSKAGHGSHALHRAAGGPAGRGERRHDNRGKAGQLVRRAAPGGLVGASSLQAASICSVEINELNEEAIELIFTFLPAEDRRSAAAVCRLWRRVHNSSTKLWGSVLLSGERLVQAAASAAAAGPVGAWLAARLGAMRAVRLWSPAHPLESFASSLAQLLSRENRVQVGAGGWLGAGLEWEAGWRLVCAASCLRKPACKPCMPWSDPHTIAAALLPLPPRARCRASATCAPT